jgi:hypothetical protein
MSKVDAMRAMREAKYARGGKPPDPPGTPAAKAPAGTRKAVRATAKTPAVEAVATDELCGHRNMGGKSCSRPAGHSEKNHRYAAS